MAPRTLKLVACLAALWLVACATAPPAPDSRWVDSLTLEGTHQVSAHLLKEKIVTAASPWWSRCLPGLKGLVWFDATTWQADLRRLLRYYEAQGFYQARVLEESVGAPQPGRVQVLVRLREGKPARLEALDLDGLEELPLEHRHQLLRGLALSVGDIFLEDSWGRAKAQLLGRLRELGYAEAVVTGEAVVDVATPAVRASLNVQPGRRYRFGELLVPIEVRAQVPGRLIREQAADGVRTGEWYSEAALADAQARVFQMGVFGAVKVNRGAPDKEDGTIPVVVDVREAPFRSLRAGVGGGGDSSRNALYAVFEYTNRNLGLTRQFSSDARLDRLTVKARAGWAALPDVVRVLRGDDSSKHGPIVQLLTEYAVPKAFGKRDVSSQTSVTLARALEAAFDYSGAEFKTALVWRPRSYLSFVPSLNFNAYLLNSELSLSSAAPTAALGCPTLPLPCVIAFADLSVDWDRRDQKLEPTRGVYAALNLQGGLSQTSRMTPYARVMPEVRGYVGLGRERRVTISGKLRAGTLIALDNETPIIARFFSGGSAMRGFSQRRLSPLAAHAVLDTRTREPLAVVDPNDPSAPRRYLWAALPIGGSGLVEASLEVRWRPLEDFSFAVFSDVGAVTKESLFEARELWRQLYVAVGLGVRYQTPLGPLRLDLALRLPGVGPSLMPALPITTTDSAGTVRDVYLPTTGGCFFGLGYGGNPQYAGAPENLCNWHLSIGEAF